MTYALSVEFTPACNCRICRFRGVGERSLIPKRILQVRAVHEGSPILLAGLALWPSSSGVYSLAWVWPTAPKLRLSRDGKTFSKARLTIGCRQHKPFVKPIWEIHKLEGRGRPKILGPSSDERAPYSQKQPSHMSSHRTKKLCQLLINAPNEIATQPCRTA